MSNLIDFIEAEIYSVDLPTFKELILSREILIALGYRRCAYAERVTRKADSIDTDSQKQVRDLTENELSRKWCSIRHPM